MAIYRTTISDNPLEMPAAEGYYDSLDDAMRGALGTAVSPVGASDPWETVTLRRETGTDAATLIYTLTWTGTFSNDITTSVIVEELTDVQGAR